VFPPSKNLEEYLKSFISGHFDSSNPQIAVLSKFCHAKLTRICKAGPRGKVPTVAEIDRAKVITDGLDYKGSAF
jgi:hypothetical protein